MTEPRTKAEKEAGELSKTTKTYLRELWIKEVFGREKDIMNKYLEKGLLVEEDALELVGDVHNTIYVKNKDYFQNPFIKGTPDYCKDKVIDTKASWSIYTFFESELSKDYYWQLQGYMQLTDHKEAILAYCLVDTPEHLIYEECNRLKWKMGVIDPDNDKEYQEACEKIEKSMTFGDIPKEKRVREFSVERNNEDLAKLEVKIVKCREYLNSL